MGIVLLMRPNCLLQRQVFENSAGWVIAISVRRVILVVPFVGSALLWQMWPKGVRGLELAPMLNVSFAHVMRNVTMAADSMPPRRVLSGQFWLIWVFCICCV